MKQNVVELGETKKENTFRHYYKLTDQDREEEQRKYTSIITTRAVNYWHKARWCGGANGERVHRKQNSLLL